MFWSPASHFKAPNPPQQSFVLNQLSLPFPWWPFFSNLLPYDLPSCSLEIISLSTLEKKMEPPSENALLLIATPVHWPVSITTFLPSFPTQWLTTPLCLGSLLPASSEIMLLLLTPLLFFPDSFPSAFKHASDLSYRKLSPSRRPPPATLPPPHISLTAKLFDLSSPDIHTSLLFIHLHSTEI